MSILIERPSDAGAAFRRAYRPTSALAKNLHVDDEMLHVSLTDGRIVSVSIIWFPLLHAASADQRGNCQIDGGGVSLHWPDIDEDISVAGLLDGADWRST